MSSVSRTLWLSLLLPSVVFAHRSELGSPDPASLVQTPEAMIRAALERELAAVAAAKRILADRTTSLADLIRSLRALAASATDLEERRSLVRTLGLAEALAQASRAPASEATASDAKETGGEVPRTLMPAPPPPNDDEGVVNLPPSNDGSGDVPASVVASEDGATPVDSSDFRWAVPLVATRVGLVDRGRDVLRKVLRTLGRVGRATGLVHRAPGTPPGVAGPAAGKSAAHRFRLPSRIPALLVTREARRTAAALPVASPGEADAQLEVEGRAVLLGLACGAVFVSLLLAAGMRYRRARRKHLPTGSLPT